MGGHENRCTRALDVLEQRVKGLLHERVEALGWLIQNQQRRLGLESLDDSQLALHAGAVLPQPPAQVASRQLQPFTEFLSIAFINRAPVKTGKEIQRFE